MTTPESGDYGKTFLQKLEERRKYEAMQAAAASPASRAPVTETEFSHLAPDSSEDARSDEDRALDQVIQRIDIIDAYTKWCGKMVPKKRTGQTESIMISCPIPGHHDSNPSAWINTQKQTWFCGGCDKGGDTFDLAAFYFDVADYKNGANFHDLRRKMAETYGYTFITPAGADHPMMIAPETETLPEPDEPSVLTSTPTQPSLSEPESDTNSDGASISTIHDLDNDDETIIFPTLEWREIVEPDTFLDKYCKATSIDDVPEEFHFWNGLIALGLVAGRDVTLFDRLPVLANLFVCLLGHTGDGKSQSYTHFRRLLREALPHKWDDPNSKGTRVISSPGSGEVLIFNFSKPVPDPNNPKVISYFAPVRGLIEFNEFSALTARTNRQGNALKPVLMEFYDGGEHISTSSMGTGMKEAHLPFASAFTTTQPKALRELIHQADADSGFLNRWVFASGKEKKRIAIGGVKVDLTDSISELKNLVGWIGFGKEIQWEPEAVEVFTQFFHKILQPKKRSDDSGLLTRIDLLMKKLILLFSINGKHDTVTVETVGRAMAMYDYLVAAYNIPAAQIGRSFINEMYDEVVRHCKRITEQQGRGPTIRELSQRMKRKYPVDKIEQMVKLACNNGDIKLVNKTGVGRPSVRYEYVG